MGDVVDENGQIIVYNGQNRDQTLYLGVISAML